MDRNTKTIPIPNGAEHMMGAIQWIDLGEAVQAKANNPCSAKRQHVMVSLGSSTL